MSHVATAAIWSKLHFTVGAEVIHLFIFLEECVTGLDLLDVTFSVSVRKS